MALDHDFKKFPELTNNQMQFFYFVSPHKQIAEDFEGTCVKVIDGDTIRVKWNERNFDFPVRFLGTASPEKKEAGGEKAKKWLEGLILNQQIEIKIDKENRVGKFGRILGTIIHRGININEQSIKDGFAVPFEQRNEAIIPDFNKQLEKIKI